MQYFLELLISIMANIAAYFVCKRLDGDKNDSKLCSLIEFIQIIKGQVSSFYQLLISKHYFIIP
ncbi:hypothetical protein CBF28_00360 [Vagococcus carniphilus]|uniref:Uncharacterized protein n=1 Tax=Vagococcus carniphilus TaxID=218144 RepID=A0A430B8L4_9ENTE|nr:hypothetical protein CBF28_00360 [Vagococcus carniphilus]